jgi:hypothetical protein
MHQLAGVHVSSCEAFEFDTVFIQDGVISPFEMKVVARHGVVLR